MQLTGILATLAVVAATFVSAAPSPLVVDKKIPGVRYKDGVQFTPDAHVLGAPAPAEGQRLQARASAKALTYYGGPVLKNVEVTLLNWGGATYASKLPGFYKGVTSSTYYDMLSQYSGIGRGTYKGAITLSNLPSATDLDDANDIQPYLRSLVQDGTITPTANSYFPIHFASGYSISQGGQSSCVEFCAYHNTIDISDISDQQYLFYGIIPDQGGSCAGGCGTSSSTFNNLCSVSSHELVEATTDPAVGLATGNAAPLAWYNSQYGEIGDICNAQQGTITGGDGNTYTVQKEWSNKASACVLK
ncbi:hypothetical protein DFJ73DRAFT_918556 [Zopfochytrium polystomum]|nr:hypothetical protein DFJ73DRAFT_918556 [Zopfochytrium polystomum]